VHVGLLNYASIYYIYHTYAVLHKNIFYRNTIYRGFRWSVGCLAFPLTGLLGACSAAQGVYLMIDASQIGSAKRAGHRDELQPSAAAARTRSDRHRA